MSGRDEAPPTAGPGRPTVHSLQVRAVEIPLASPIETAGGTIRTSPLLLIDLLTREGINGAAYLFCYTPLVLAPLARLLMNLGDLLRGTPAAAVPAARTIEAHVRLLGSAGLVGMAVAGIDMALWDVTGKVHGLPVARLLGATAGTVPAYAGVRSMQPEAAGHEAARAVEAGFGAVKVKLGHPSLDTDLAVVRAVREAIGFGPAIMADYNQSLSLEEALIRGRALEAEGLAWIEEPLHAEDDAGHACLARELHTPIQLGENWWGTHSMERSLAANACDLVTVDAARIGGVTGWRAAAGMAHRAELSLSSHRYPEASTHLLAASPTAHWLEYVDTVSPVLERPLQVEGGHALVPSEPGLGLIWDERAVERFLVGEQ